MEAVAKAAEEVTIPSMTGAFWPAGVRVHHGAMVGEWLVAIDAVLQKRVVVVIAVRALEPNIGRKIEIEISQKAEADRSAVRTVSGAIRKPGQEETRILRLPHG